MDLNQEHAMRHLTAGQQALLETDLQLRQRQLDRRLQEHHGGLSRVEHAHELLTQDAHDAPQREGDREMDMALSDLETLELGAVNQALARLQDGSNGGSGRYGRCTDCDADIPFDRLKAEPWALRCIACETVAEAAGKRRGS
jgi:DnaK suppressor protein